MQIANLIIQNKTKLFALLLFSLGVGLILFLSWKANPDVKELSIIPEWIANWADQIQNNRRRTAIPFIGLGLLTGVYLIFSKRTAPIFWFSAWLILNFIVCLAEVGQYFLPTRQVDPKDIFWGAIGAAIGLVFPFLAYQFISIINLMYYGNKRD